MDGYDTHRVRYDTIQRGEPGGRPPLIRISRAKLGHPSYQKNKSRLLCCWGLGTPTEMQWPEVSSLQNWHVYLQWEPQNLARGVTCLRPDATGVGANDPNGGEAAPSSTSRGTVERRGDGGGGSTEATLSRYESQ
ncbi:Serine/threonine-protein phosphatase [Forsythia ovata]|uniref:Serine/threonine-protein phosphatase n=1 Tax=Forsythia ovata TaxID=205694 RepID=A0ABD1WRW8_9LAMI